MTNDEQVALYIEAREHFGQDHQMCKCAEECCELATAIMRYTNGCDGHSQQEIIDNIMEEIVDTDIMLNQMWGIFGGMKDSMGRTLEDIKMQKLCRLKCRIEEE